MVDKRENQMSSARLARQLPWLMCGLAAVFYCYEYFLRITPSLMKPELIHHFSFNMAAFGALGAFYYHAYNPMQLPVGIMMDHYGPRRLLTFACLLCVVGTMLFASTHLFSVAALGRALTGFGSAFAYVGVLKLATIWLPEDRLAMISGMTSAMGTVGGMLSEMYVPNVIDGQGWQSVLNYSVWAGLVLALLLWFVIRDEKPLNGEKTKQARKVRKEKTSYHHLIVDLVIILKNPQIWINGLISCLVYLPTTAFAELWGYSYLREARNYSPNDAGTCIAIMFLGFAFGAPLWGWFSDRIHRRKLPILIGAVMTLLFFSILIYMPWFSIAVTKAVMFLVGVGYSTHVIAFPLAREISPPEASATSIAASNMIIMLGGQLCQPLIGKLLDLRGTYKGYEVISYSMADYQFALSIIPIGIFGALIMCFFLKETHCKVISE